MKFKEIRRFADIPYNSKEKIMGLISSVRFIDNNLSERKPKQGKPGQKQIHAVVDEKEGVNDNQASTESETRIGGNVDVSV